MADREVTADIVANDRTDRGVRSAASRFDRLNRHIQRKADEWAKHGDRAGTRFAGRAITAMSRVVAATGKIGTKIASGLSSGLEAGGPILKGALLGVLAGAASAGAPILAAGIASGILLGLGGGVLALGISQAVQNPNVQKAFDRLGERAKKAFRGFGSPFVGPLQRAADAFGDSIERIGKSVKSSGLDKTFGKIVDKLAPALAEMAERALPGILEAAEASAPFFEKLAEHAPEIGEAISKFFSHIADAAPGALLFFERFLQAIEVLLPIIGAVISFLSNLFTRVDRGIQLAIVYFTRFGRRVLDVFSAIVTGAATALGWVPGLGPKLEAAAEKFKAFRDRANAYLAGIEDEIVNVDVRIREQRIRAAKGGAPAHVGALEFAAGPSFALAGAGGGGRTGGPTHVESFVQVDLDGEPFRQMTVRAVDTAQRRTAWRNKIGRRK